MKKLMEIVQKIAESDLESYRSGFIVPEEFLTSVLEIKNGYLNYCHIEELYDILVENYYEFELELLRTASRFIVSLDISHSTLMELRNLIARRLANVTTSSRMYIDQMEKHVKKIFGDESSEYLRVKKFISQQYDSLLGYRTLEKLRNYAQHRGFPISFAGASFGTDKHATTSKLSFTCIPYISINDMRQDSKFPRYIIDELVENCPEDNVDLRPLVREYLYGISCIHSEVRNILSSPIKSWESAITFLIDNVGKNFDPHNFVTFWESKGKNNQLSIHLSKKVILRKDELVKKNSVPQRFHYYFISNQIDEEELKN